MPSNFNGLSSSTAAGLGAAIESRVSEIEVGPKKATTEHTLQPSVPANKPGAGAVANSNLPLPTRFISGCGTGWMAGRSQGLIAFGNSPNRSSRGGT